MAIDSRVAKEGNIKLLIYQQYWYESRLLDIQSDVLNAVYSKGITDTKLRQGAKYLFQAK